MEKTLDKVQSLITFLMFPLADSKLFPRMGLCLFWNWVWLGFAKYKDGLKPINNLVFFLCGHFYHLKKLCRYICLKCICHNYVYMYMYICISFPQVGSPEIGHMKWGRPNCAISGLFKRSPLHLSSTCLIDLLSPLYNKTYQNKTA